MTAHNRRQRRGALTLALLLVSSAVPAFAQQTDHSQHAPPTSDKPVPDPHAGHAMPATPPVNDRPTQQPATEVDHAAMGHAMPTSTPPTPTDPADHSAREMPVQQANEEPVDHAAMGHSPAVPPSPTEGDSEVDHSKMDHSRMGHDMPAQGSDLPPDAAPLEPFPPITAADRAAAFPDVAGHTVHDTATHWFAMFNRLETWDADEGKAFGWEGSGWIGTDLDRLWIRSEGEAIDGSIESADVEVLYGRAVAPWWDAVIGLRHNFGEYPSQTFAAVGVMGLAPYMFEVSATAYLGESGQFGANVEAEYETLFTNKLILQSLVEADVWGKDDARRGIGSGLSKIEAGFRLRYEFTREFAPYIGVVRERVFGGTADLRRGQGGHIDDTRLVIGLRTWF